MANAVPVVLPDHGSFTEMITDTGGGLLHRPHDPADLAETSPSCLRDPVRATQLGLNANSRFMTATTPPRWPGKQLTCIAAFCGDECTPLAPREDSKTTIPAAWAQARKTSIKASRGARGVH